MVARRFFIALFILASLALATCAPRGPAGSPAAATAGGSRVAAPIEWTLVGPFQGSGSGADATGLGADLLAGRGGETALAMPDTTPPSDAPTLRAAERDGQLDFLAAFPGRAWSCAYAYRDFDSAGGDAVLRVGSDDGIRLWLNGEQLLDERVMRALDPDSSLIRAKLSAGRNRILAKVDQGTGEWALSVRVSSAAGELARAESRKSIGLSATQVGASVGGAVAFVVSSDPPFAVDFPLEYEIVALGGGAAASGACSLGERARARLDPAAEGFFRLSARPARSAASPLAGNFAGAEASAILVVGDKGRALDEAASRAEAAARRAESAAFLDDTVATLEFLAARMRGSLHPTLESDSLRLQAAAFSEDLIAAMREGRSGPAALRGYRQMAYRSVVDGALQPYSLYLPQGYDPSRQYGLVVSLHGYTGQDYDGGLHLAKECPEDFIVLSPFGRGDMHYRSIGEEDVLEAMDRVMARYSVDPDRVYLTGISMGGLGTWRIGEMYPDRFAAIAPFCGWTGQEWLGNLRSVPALVVHGDADDSVPISYDEGAVAAMRKLGFDVRFDVLPGVGHGAWAGWRLAKPDESIFDFFRAHVRNPSPQRITASIPYARYGAQYWIRIDELDTGGELAKRGGSADRTTPRLPAPCSVDARRASPSRIEISTARVRALTVDLELAFAGAAVQPAKGAAGGATLVVDGTRIDAPAGAREVSLSRKGKGAWRIDSGPPPAGLPRHDGGGLADLFTRPLVIAYGTRDSARRPVLESAARALADWSWTQSIQIGVKTGRFVVKADFAVTDEDLASKDVLVMGTARENTLAARCASVIDPYYRAGQISLGGKDFPRAGLALLLPSPLAPDRMLGYLDLPAYVAPSAAAAAAWCSGFQFRLRNVDVGGSATYPGFCPDVMALTMEPFTDAWSGWFDRNWENLEGR
jgi:hypothetical protein